MSGTLIEQYAQLHALLDDIAAATSNACSEAEVAELAITHEHAVRRLGSVGLHRILDVSDRDAHRAVHCSTLIEFVAQRLRITNPKKRLRQVSALSQLHAATGEKLPPRTPATAAAMADGALGHDHVDAVLDVLAKIPSATAPELRDLADTHLA
ncbi:DUF222 domain-containing protein, partial [Williamsia sp. CHRR-6]|uniref:DUF222 domain-containing protein n=1 Tax=Williamsia sp. CHRR-6 TaxID=2835871 RepID=UPI001BD99358